MDKGMDTPPCAPLMIYLMGFHVSLCRGILLGNAKLKIGKFTKLILGMGLQLALTAFPATLAIRGTSLGVRVETFRSNLATNF